MYMHMQAHIYTYTYICLTCINISASNFNSCIFKDCSIRVICVHQKSDFIRIFVTDCRSGRQKCLDIGGLIIEV